ncbi:tetratricopeptide repeat protein [Flavobacterium sp.]|uniref:tetratricopeptide repeat protein n=1 Tax=Flavobacterium sp. TaxID=239 RepID=UPI00391D81AA
MKIKHIVLASSILVSVSASAQKDELKSLKRIYAKEVIKGNDLAEYKNLVAKAEPLATEEGDKIYVAFYKSMTPLLEINAVAMDPATAAQAQATIARALSPKSIADFAAGLNATLDYEKKTGKKVYTDDILETIGSYKPQIVEVATGYGKAGKSKEAADVLYSLYQLDKKDADMLFYAASYAVNGQDYEKALQFYTELKALNYSGEGTFYYAVNNTSKQEESFGANKSLRDISVNTTKTHSKPRDEKNPSKKSEINKNIALILIQQGKSNEAILAVQEARKSSPEDDSLLFAEMDIYLKLKDFDSYTRLVNEALAKNPNNADLVFNLGVITGNAGKLDEAEKYYLKAIEINPSYFNAYLNFAELKLRADEKWVTELNKLGTSEKDNKRYEVIKKLREDNFKLILPYLEKAVDLEPTNDPAKRTLLSVYNALEMTDKYKALKAKL